MSKILVKVLLLLLMVSSLLAQSLFQNLGGQKAGTAVFPFLKIETSAFGASLAGAGVAVPRDASSMFYNPAAISHIPGRDIVLMHLDLPAEIDYDYMAFSTPVRGPLSLGVSFGILHMEPMIETTEYMPFGTGRTFIYSDEFFALTMSLQLSDRFTVGTTAKYARETLDNLTMGGVLLDFGTVYKTGLGSMRIASSMTNFGAQFAPSGTYSKVILGDDGEPVMADSLAYQSFSPPTAFRLGVAHEFLDTESNRITGTFQLNHQADAAEIYSFGMEYAFKKIASLRAGYVMNRGGFGLTLGGGVNLTLPGGILFRFDYSYTSARYLTDPQRYSMGVSL